MCASSNRLRQLSRQLCGAAGPSPDMHGGFGCLSSSTPPQFTPEDVEAAAEFFNHNGFVVIACALPPSDIAELNAFYDRTQRDHPRAWGAEGGSTIVRALRLNQGLLYSQPLLDHPGRKPQTRSPLDVCAKRAAASAVACAPDRFVVVCTSLLLQSSTASPSTRARSPLSSASSEATMTPATVTLAPVLPPAAERASLS